MKIICKTTLLPAEPAFVGTTVGIRVPEDHLTWGYRTALPVGDSYTVDWGDGTVETIAATSGVRHNYAEPGDYTVRFADELVALGLSNATGELNKYFAPMIRTVSSNAAALTTLVMQCFRNCINVESVDLRDSGLTYLETGAFYGCLWLTDLSFLPPGITGLASFVFEGCTTLIDATLPSVDKLDWSAGQSPAFSNCTGLREIRFSRANESAITSSAAYRADPTLGAANATVKFV